MLLKNETKSGILIQKVESMASFGAHLNQAVSAGTRPSIFDLVAQDSLASSLKPALEYVLKILFARNPDRWLSFWGFSNELLYSLLGIVETYYLWKKNCSFSEYFYGLERTCQRISAGQALSNKKRMLSLLFLVGVPFLQAKLLRIYEHMKEKQEVLQSCKSGKISRKQFCTKLYFNWYPYFHAITESLSFLTYLAYILKFSNAHCLSHLLLGLHLKYTDHDLHANDSQTNDYVSKRKLASLISKTGNMVLRVFSFLIETALPVGVFFLQFLQWWYESDTDLQKTVLSLPVPPPPKEIEVIVLYLKYSPIQFLWQLVAGILLDRR